MQYYKLMYDYEKDNEYVFSDIANIGTMNEYITISGKRIEHWENVIFEYDSAQGNILTDYLANLYRWLVVSDKFRQVTEDVLENQVQYLPVKLKDRLTNYVVDSYSVANIITLIDALDLQKSKYDIFELDDKKIISVEKYALKRDKILDKHIFRLKDDEIPVFVSETLKKVIEDNGLIGFEFLQVDVI